MQRSVPMNTTQRNALRAELERMDLQHANLIHTIHCLHHRSAQPRPGAEIERLFGLLRSQLLEHFRAEERLMIDQGVVSGDYRAHVREHGELIVLLDQLHGRVRDDFDRHELKVEVERQLLHGLDGHISGQDREMETVLAERAG